MRNKRFRLVLDQRKTGERDFRCWPREKGNESHSSPPSPSPSRPFTHAIFGSVFDSRSSIFSPNRTEIKRLLRRLWKHAYIGRYMPVIGQAWGNNWIKKLDGWISAKFFLRQLYGPIRSQYQWDAKKITKQISSHFGPTKFRSIKDLLYGQKRTLIFLVRGRNKGKYTWVTTSHYFGGRRPYNVRDGRAREK